MKLLALGLFCWLNLAIQEAPSEPSVLMQDPSAILKRSQKNYRMNVGLTADITYEFRAPRYRPKVQSGSISYLNRKFNIKLKDEHLISNGRTLWVVHPLKNEVMSFNLLEWKQENFTTFLYQVFNMPVQARLLDVIRVRGEDCYHLSIQMKNPNLSFSQAVIWIDTKEFLVRKMSFISRRQSVQTYTFSNVKIGVNLPDRLFQFRKEDYPSIRRREPEATTQPGPSRQYK
ncbi:MAG: outer membrane lipoprotein carrier protein LolA [Bacteroidota bacterium]